MIRVLPTQEINTNLNFEIGTESAEHFRAQRIQHRTPTELANKGCEALAVLIPTYNICKDMFIAFSSCGTALELIVQSGQPDFRDENEIKRFEFRAMRKLCEAFGSLWKVGASELMNNGPWPEDSIAQSIYDVREMLFKTIDEATKFIKGFSPDSLNKAMEAFELSKDIAEAAIRLPTAPRLF